MILAQHVDTHDLEDMLAFYCARYDSVEVVQCLKCSSYLYFELRGDAYGMQVDETGKIVIPIGTAPLSRRVRLDEAPTGERMVGYHCGAMLPNPEHAKAVAAYDKEYAKLTKDLKPGEPSPEYLPPYVPEQIECGNRTLLAEVEVGMVPIGQLVQLSPFEKHSIANRIKELNKPVDYRQEGNTKYFETFSVERIK